MTMGFLRTALAAGATAIALCACTSGNSAVEPPFHSTSLANLKLQFAVGTANIGTEPNGSGVQGQTTGLNTVVTFRQTDGDSAVLLDTPAITGPPAFRVPNAPDAGTDAGTNHITAQQQTIPGGSPPPGGTFAQTGGAFGFGFAPDNTDTFGSANCGLYPLPFYASAASGGSGFPSFPSGSSSSGAVSSVNQDIGGPPAFPTTMNGTVPPCTNQAFFGYSEGFVDFVARPVSGAYSLSVLVPTAAGSSTPPTTFTASATLRADRVLPPMPPPSLALDGKGGGTVTVDVPNGVSETFVEIYDLSGNCHSPSGPQWFTIMTRASGVQHLSLPDNLGAGPPNAPTQSLCAPASSFPGDTYLVWASGVDFPAFEASYPGNRAASPAIAGGAGQADVTTSFPTLGSTGSSSSLRRR
jgi:hypothetical protein